MPFVSIKDYGISRAVFQFFYTPAFCINDTVLLIIKACPGIRSRQRKFKKILILPLVCNNNKKFLHKNCHVLN